MKLATYSQQLAVSAFFVLCYYANFEITRDSECHHGKQVFLSSASPVLASLFILIPLPHLMVSLDTYFFLMVTVRIMRCQALILV